MLMKFPMLLILDANSQITKFCIIAHQLHKKMPRGKHRRKCMSPEIGFTDQIK